jgi:molybdate transport system regulatory protein
METEPYIPDPGSDGQKTSFANLIRYAPSQTYFARIRVKGKLIRHGLKTKTPTVAKLRPGELKKNQRNKIQSARCLPWGIGLPVYLQPWRLLWLMKKKSKPEDSLSLHLRLQVVGKEKIALGPGKIELMNLLAETGSIGEAARRMNMSYMKAWSLVQTIKPLVATTRGGNQRGGAEITAAGHEVLALYRKMENDSRRASETSWLKLRRLLRKAI